MSTSPSETTGANVRAEMARRNKSQTSMAVLLGMSQPSLSARLLGKTPFDINELTHIAQILEVPLAVLLPDEAVARAG